MTSRAECFQWPTHYIKYAQSQPAYDRLARRLARINLSTAFTGICTPSCSLEALQMAIRCDGNTSFVAAQTEFSYLYGIDMDVECRHECRTLPHPPSCMFSTMDSFLADGILAECLALGEEPSWEDLCDILWKPGAVLLTSSSCDVHGSTVTCRLLQSWCHVAGIPCTDFSSQGKKRRCCGPSIRGTLIWIRHRQLLCEPVLIVENVVHFDHIWLQRLLPMFEMQHCNMDAKDSAMPISRVRKYMVLTFTGWRLERPLSDVPELFKRERAATFTMYDLFVAPQPELDLELAWGFNRRAKVKEGGGAPSSRRTFLSALVGWEHRFLDRYVAVKGPLRVYGLQQDPDSGYASASSLVELQCLIKHSHLMWIHKLQRWMTGRELLASQGFPAYDGLLREMQPWVVPHESPVALCSMNRSRTCVNLPPRSRKQFGHMAGNAMTVPIVGAVMMYSFMHVVEDCSSGTALPRCLSLVSASATAAPAADAFFKQVQARQRRRRSIEPSSNSSTSKSLCSSASSPGGDSFLSRQHCALVSFSSSIGSTSAGNTAGSAGSSGSSSSSSTLGCRRSTVLALPAPVMNSVLVAGPVGATQDADAEAACEFFNRLSAARRSRKRRRTDAPTS